MKYTKRTDDVIGPGTAGIAQRISTAYDVAGGKETKVAALAVLKRNYVQRCGQNQY